MRSSRLIGAAFLITFGLTCGMAPRAGAQSGPAYPSQLVRIVVPLSAGSTSDILARAISDKLSQVWRQQVIVENRPGITGTAVVAKSPADGYTMMLTSNGHTVIGKANANLNFDPVNDFVGVTKIASMPLTMVVPPESPAKSLGEFIAMVKASSGKLNYASAGLASTAYIAGELLKQTAKIDMVHVPYRGTPDALTSIMRNDTAMFFVPAANGLDLIQTGKVRALAVSGATRYPSLPNVPTFAEAGMPQFIYDAWFGMFAPANTPPAVLQKISADIGAVLNMPEVKTLLMQQGVTPSPSTPEEFTALLRSDTARFTAMLPDLEQK